MKIYGTLVLLLVAGGAAWFWTRKGAEAPQYRLAAVEQGDLVVTVTATGTLQPVTTVQVGTQVTGTILKLFADFNSRVTRNQVIAEIDPASFKARVAQDQANLARSEADVRRVQASLDQAVSELKRTREMVENKLVSPSDLEAAVANEGALVAQLAVARATVDQTRATLEMSNVNLQYTTIVSPIDGTVISRNVDVGQTVAASLSAPTLFVIADDLKKIQVQASVSEADIGRVAEGQGVTFTVDAYRDKKFSGKVSQVRLAPTTVQNVVTYTVIINAENPEEKLLPGMTATVALEISRSEDVLKVPNAALRYTPPTETPPEAAARKPRRPGEGRPPSRVWILGPAGPTPETVVTGETDGSFTVITKGNLQKGQEVIVGAAQETPGAAMSNPFFPGRPRGR